MQSALNLLTALKGQTAKTVGEAAWTTFTARMTHILDRGLTRTSAAVGEQASCCLDDRKGTAGLWVLFTTFVVGTTSGQKSYHCSSWPRLSFCCALQAVRLVNTLITLNAMPYIIPYHPFSSLRLISRSLASVTSVTVELYRNNTFFILVCFLIWVTFLFAFWDRISHSATSSRDSSFPASTSQFSSPMHGICIPYLARKNHLCATQMSHIHKSSVRSLPGRTMGRERRWY